MGPVEWGVLAVVALLGVTVQATVGFGSAFFIAPALFALRPAPEAVIAVLALGVALTGLVLYGEKRRHVADRPVVRVVLIAAVPGMIAGAYLVHAVSQDAIQIAVGLVIVAGGLVQLQARPSARTASSLPGGAVCGLAAGALTTSTGLNGPPLALWVTRHVLEPRGLRDTIAACLLGLNLAGAVCLALIGDRGQDLHGLVVAAALLPVILAGHRVGRTVFRSLSPAGHRRTVLAMVAVTGTASVALGLA